MNETSESGKSFEQFGEKMQLWHDYLGLLMEGIDEDRPRWFIEVFQVMIAEQIGHFETEQFEYMTIDPCDNEVTDLRECSID